MGKNFGLIMLKMLEQSSNEKLLTNSNKTTEVCNDKQN